ALPGRVRLARRLHLVRVLPERAAGHHGRHLRVREPDGRGRARALRAGRGSLAGACGGRAAHPALGPADHRASRPAAATGTGVGRGPERVRGDQRGALTGGGKSRASARCTSGYTTSTSVPAITARCTTGAPQARLHIGSRNAPFTFACGPQARPVSTPPTA